MTEASKTRLTFKKTRLILFIHSYALHHIKQNIKKKYKLNRKLTQKELRIKYFNKKALPEISRLSKTLNLFYKPLWEAIILDKAPAITRRFSDREKIMVYLAIERELILLSETKQNKSSPFFDPDYEQEFFLLSTAIERAVGNKLMNTRNDYVFEHKMVVLQKLYVRSYYKITRKYKLPTIRIVPFVLRLIN